MGEEIQIVIIPRNEEVKNIAKLCTQKKLDIRPILYPTVLKGQERLRIVLHSYNTVDEVNQLLEILSE